MRLRLRSPNYFASQLLLLFSGNVGGSLGLGDGGSDALGARVVRVIFFTPLGLQWYLSVHVVIKGNCCYPDV